MKLQMWILLVGSAVLLFQRTDGQIPSVCAHDGHLLGSERRCCPNECGGQSRGRCQPVNVTRSSTKDPRINWPAHYFTNTCVCNDNFGGVDCGSCAYGYYPYPDCDRKSNEKRPNLKELDATDWREYRKIIKKMRNTDSGYVVVVNGSAFNPDDGYSSIQGEVRNVSLYNFFVWIHYLVAKDSDMKGTNKKDFAHESTGFLTWHRQMLLWLEWEVQQMIRNNTTLYSKPSYQFRLPFWDWTNVTERNANFRPEHLGETPDMSNSPVVRDGNQPIDLQLFGPDGMKWQTICWKNKRNPDGSDCDPANSTGPLKRCPTIGGDNICKTSSYWPDSSGVNTAIGISTYDTRNYDPCSENSFRNYLEGFLKQPSGCASDDAMCTEQDEDRPCHRTRQLHNSVHLILGTGDIGSFIDDNVVPDDRLGVMAHVAASPNDPIFINHHAMIDCIFDEWLKKNPAKDYPSGVNTNGHRKEDYIVPFIPLFKHSQMFQKAENFGYHCDLSHITNNNNGGSNNGGNNGGRSNGGSNRPPDDDEDDHAEGLAPYMVITMLVSVGILVLTMVNFY